MARAVNPGAAVRYANGRPVAPGDSVDVDPENVPTGLLLLGDPADGPAPQPPPRSGRGSGQPAWSSYATAVGHADLVDADRDDIVDELARRGVDIGTDPESDPTPDPEPQPQTFDQDGDL